MTSLKRTLLRWLLPPLVLIVVAASAMQYLSMLRPANEALDRALGDTAFALGSLVRLDAGTPLLAWTPEAERLLRTDSAATIYFAVVDPHGRLMAGDQSLGALDLNAGQLPGRLAWVDGTLGDQALRIAVLDVPCGAALCQVRVGETRSKRLQIQRNALASSTAALLLLVTAVVVTTALAVRHALRPLEQVREHIARRSLEDLSAVEQDGAPAEVQPLLTAINRLFERLRSAAQQQRAFLADAAHQLRTPLTSLKTDSELALLEPHPPQMQPTLSRLAASAARAARLTEQLLSLARTDSGARSQTPEEPVDLRDVAAAAAEEWVPRAVDAGVDLGFDLQPGPVKGRRHLLRELLGNLIHNALEHAGRGARVTVRTGVDGSGPLLEVEDSGPGIPATDRERMFERFVRGSQATPTGSGLGLAIVRDVARAHGAKVALLDASGGGSGLRVRVRFPRG